MAFRYEDFFGDEKKKAAKGRLKLPDEFEEESDSGDDLDVGGVNEVCIIFILQFILWNNNLWFCFQMRIYIMNNCGKVLFFFCLEKWWTFYPWKATSEASIGYRADGERKFRIQTLDYAGRGNLWFYNLYCLSQLMNNYRILVLIMFGMVNSTGYRSKQAQEQCIRGSSRLWAEG